MENTTCLLYMWQVLSEIEYMYLSQYHDKMRKSVNFWLNNCDEILRGK